MDSLEGINYRALNAEEFARKDLQEIFLKYRAFIPNPLVSHIQIAEKDGKIVALGVLQPQYHAEPIFVAEEYRDTQLHKHIIESLLKPLESIKGLRVFIFSPNNHIAKLASRFGFKFKNYEVFEKEF